MAEIGYARMVYRDTLDFNMTSAKVIDRPWPAEYRNKQSKQYKRT